MYTLYVKLSVGKSNFGWRKTRLKSGRIEKYWANKIKGTLTIKTDLSSPMGAIKYKHNSLLKVLNNEKYNQKHLKRKPRSISGKILGSITMPHPEAQANSAMARGRLSSTFTCNVLEILPGSTTVRVTLTDAVSPGSNSPAEGSNSHFICCFSSWKNKLKL